MTQLTSADDRTSPPASAASGPQRTGQEPERPLTGALADPRIRLVAGLAVMLATASAARHGRVSRCEATAFRAVNGLPNGLYPPAWVIMQLGTLGAAPAAAGVAGQGPQTGGSAPRRRRSGDSGAYEWGKSGADDTASDGPQRV